MLETEQLANHDVLDSSPESICAGVAKAFGVRITEVALLEVKGNVLKFLYPAELKNAGAIPISSSSVAARTARTRRSELFNSFTRVKHSSVFEVIKLAESGSGADVIQKLMTVPVFSADDKVIGVLQVSRKASSPAEAGADFTSEDLRKLEGVAIPIGKVLAQS